MILGFEIWAMPSHKNNPGSHLDVTARHHECVVQRRWLLFELRKYEVTTVSHTGNFFNVWASTVGHARMRITQIRDQFECYKTSARAWEKLDEQEQIRRLWLFSYLEIMCKHLKRWHFVTKNYVWSSFFLRSRTEIRADSVSCTADQPFITCNRWGFCSVQTMWLFMHAYNIKFS